MIFNSIKNEYDDAISRISKGDLNALPIIYTGMYKSIFKYALSIICDYNLAEDIAQETFISIAKNANTYKSGSNSRAWVYSITHNCAINMLKRRNKEISSDNLCNKETTIDEDKILSNMILIEALRCLNEKERQIVSLKIECRFSHKEIAGLLSTTEHNSRQVFHLAIKKLRSHFKI